MQCPYCKQEIKDDARFCNKCGHKIVRCPTCNKVITSKQPFCKYDGTQLPLEILKDLPEYISTVDDETSDTAILHQKERGGSTGQDTFNMDDTFINKVSEEAKPRKRYCKECGAECAEGQLYCQNCLQKWKKDATTTPNKSKLILFLLGVLLVLLIVAGVIFVTKILPIIQEQNYSENMNINSIPESSEINSESINTEVDSESDDISKESGIEEKNSIQETIISNAAGDDRSYYGNSFENISQGGMNVSDGEWIYYISASNGFSIWKMRLDGTEKTQISDVAAGHISLKDDELFYRERENGYLKKLNLKNGEDEILVKRDIYEPKVVGDYIYFEDASDNTYDLYRINIDGSNEIKIAQGVVFYCCVTDNRIYYLDTQDERRGYSINLNGGDKRIWYDGQVGSLDYVDGLIYFTDYQEGGFYSLNPSTNEISMLSQMKMSAINVYDGWVYFADIENDYALTKMNLNNTAEVVKLDSRSADLIGVSGGWVHYHEKGSDEEKHFYWIPTDGGASEIF